MKPYAPTISLLCLCTLLYFSFFYNLGDKPIFLWDEARRAVDSLQLYFEDRWIISYYDNDPTTPSTKSPFLLWLQVASLHYFGLNEFAIRFPSALSASVSGLAIWYFCRRYFGSWWMGFLAGAVFATTYAYVFNHAGRTGDYDALLSLFTTLACLFFFSFCTDGENRRLIAFWLFLTFAVFTKGVVALMFIPGLALFALLQGKVKQMLTNGWFYLGALFLILFMGGYYAIRLRLAPDFFNSMYQNELGGRYMSALEDNGQPFYYYFKNLFSWRYAYWFFFLIPAFVAGFASKQAAIKRYTLFSLVNTLSFLIIISFSKTKLFWYDLPVYPFFAIQVALLLHQAWNLLQERLLAKLPGGLGLITAISLFVICFALPIHQIAKHNRGNLQFWPWDVDTDIRQEALFLQDAVRKGKDLNNYLVYYDQTNTHLKFYIRILQSRNNDVRLTSDPQAIKPGKKVIISQPALATALQEQYQMKQEEAQFGCTVFTVGEKTTDLYNLATEFE